MRIASFIPGIARGLFFDSVESPQASTPGTGSDDDNNDGADDDEDRYVRNIDDLLDLFADEYCNKHLVYAIIETVLVRVLPELGERSVRELMEDRGVST